MRLVIFFGIAICLAFAETDLAKPNTSDLRFNPLDYRQKRSIDKFNSIATKVVPVLKGITDALGKDGYNVQRFAGLVSTIGPALGVLGPVMGLATAILGAALGPTDSPELAYMKKAFGQVFRELTYLDTKITGLENAVERVSVFQAYKANYDKLRRIDLMFKRFSQTPDTSTESDLRNECRNHNPKHTLDWIYQRIANPRISPYLLPTILQGTNYDIKRFDIWLKMIIGDAMAASVYDQSCLAVNQPKPTDATMKADAATAQMKLRTINSKLYEYQKKLKQQFMSSGQFVRDVESVLRQGGDKRAKATNLFNFLANKYNWLYWAPLVYDPAHGGDKHWFSGFGYGPEHETSYPGLWYKWRWYDVNTVITWAPKRGYNPGQYSYDRICGAVGGESDAHKANDRIRERLTRDGVRYMSILVVRRTEGWSLHYHTTGFLTYHKCSKVTGFVLHHA